MKIKDIVEEYRRIIEKSYTPMTNEMRTKLRKECVEFTGYNGDEVIDNLEEVLSWEDRL